MEIKFDNLKKKKKKKKHASKCKYSHRVSLECCGSYIYSTCINILIQIQSLISHSSLPIDTGVSENYVRLFKYIVHMHQLAYDIKI